MFAGSGQVENTGTGTITALNGAVTLTIPTSSSAVLHVTGTWSATLIFEATVDGTNYFTIPATTLPTGPQVTTITANAAYLVGVGGYQGMQLRASAFTSGTVAVAWTADNTPNISSTVQQGNAPWTQKIIGGTDNSTIGNTSDALKVVSTPTFANNQVDAFGRLRVADTDLVESLHFANTAHPLLVSSVLTGSGTAVLSSASSSIRLTNTTSSSDSVIVQTRRYFRYNPGRSYLVTISGNVGAKKANVRQRLGYFDANNGLFFEQDSSNLKIVYRTNSSGSPVDVAVNQSSWNLDKLDGTGTSGVTIDPSKHNLYVIDFLWHGAGRVRWGIFYNGSILYCHQVNFANVQAGPFMRTPSLPMRVELTNTTTTASPTTLDLVCFAYQKEASDDITAPYSFSASTGRTSDTVGATTLPVLSIRPKATFNSLTNRVPVLPASVSVSSSGQTVLVSLILNATLTGASFISADANSATEYDLTATAMSGGTIVKQFYLAASTSIIASAEGTGVAALRELVLGLDIAGSTADILTVAVQSTAGNTNVFGTIDWEEFQ